MKLPTAKEAARFAKKALESLVVDEPKKGVRKSQQKRKQQGKQKKRL